MCVRHRSKAVMGPMVTSRRRAGDQMSFVYAVVRRHGEVKATRNGSLGSVRRGGGGCLDRLFLTLLLTRGMSSKVGHGRNALRLGHQELVLTHNSISCHGALHCS